MVEAVVKFLLDTHAALWALSDDTRLGAKVRETIMQAHPDCLAMSDISLLEISLLAERGRIKLTGSLVELLDAVADAFRILPINAAIAASVTELKLEQADPFDRIIAATARYHQLTLMTRDRRLQGCPDLATLW
jgi:PIN domain nuclease of toxin-antitoxin system